MNIIGKNRSIVIDIPLIAVALIAIYKIFFQLKYLFVGRGLQFDYTNTVGWDILILVFWMFWFVGISGFILGKGWSYSSLIPASFLSIVAAMFSFDSVQYKPLPDQIIMYGGFVLAIGTLFLLGNKNTRERFHPTSFHIKLGVILLVIYSILFFTIDQRMVAPL